MKRNITYLNRDFNGLRDQLIEYAKNYFPDSYTDFSAASPGMMFIEMAAYVGDILSFYQDNQVQETFLQYANNPGSLYAMAYMMGYRPKVTTVATTELTVSQTVPAVQVSGSWVPNWNKACRIGERSEVVSTTNPPISFLTQTPLDFSYSSSLDPTGVELSSTDMQGDPSTFLLTKKVEAFSGTVKTVTKAFGTYRKYQTVEIQDENIVGILDVTDADGNVWTEVPFLGQDTVFVDTVNSGSQGNEAPYVLQLRKVPRRFVTRFNADRNLEIQFGAGMCPEDTEATMLPNPVETTGTVQEMSDSRFDVAYDPSNFLFSKSYGLCPINTVLTIRYIVGGGLESNVGANTLTEFGSATITARDGGTVDMNTLAITNPVAAIGGRNGDTPEEVRQNALRSFAEQKRMVTLNDFNVRALSLPSRFGSVAKVYAANSILSERPGISVLDRNPLAITLYVLSYDIDGHLVPTSDTVKTNLKTYLSQYLMVTDAVDIKDAYVVDIGIKYDIALRPGYSSTDVLMQCNQALRDYFRVDKRSINETINLSEVYTLLDSVAGVQVTKRVEVVNKVGENYSKYSYDIDTALRENIIYPSYDPCIFEVRFPDVDIEGRITVM